VSADLRPQERAEPIGPVRAPLTYYLGAAAEAAPLIAAAIMRRPQRGPRFWILAWTGLMVCCDILSFWTAYHGIRNLWVGYLATVAGALVLWGLSYWQTGPTERLTLQVATFLFLAVWVILTVTFDDLSVPSRAGAPMANTVCLLAAAYTLLTRSLRSRDDLLRQDWFWVSVGLAFYFGLWNAMYLMQTLLFNRNFKLMLSLDEIGLGANILPWLVIARGMACRPGT
jgi:hypothetical protein